MELTRDRKKTILRAVGNVQAEIIITVIFFSALLIFVVSFIKREHFIYFWDSAAYWFYYREFGDLLLDAPRQAFENVKYSVLNEEYNLLPVVLLLPSRLLLGDSRLSYIVGNTILFTFPTILLFSLFFKTRVEKVISSNRNRYVYLLALICLGLSPQLWVPVLFGYLGSGGLILAILILIIYFRKDFRDQSYPTIFFIALLLSLMVLFRRWYAFWVVGFLLSISIENIFSLVRNHQKEFRKYLPVLAKLFTIGSTSFGFFVLIAPPIAKKILLTNYSDIYSGYKFTTSFLDTLECLDHYFGHLIIITAGMGFLLSLRHIEVRKTAMVLFLQFWFSLILFSNTQDMGYHHYYILLPSLQFFSCYFLLAALAITRNAGKTLVSLIAISILLILNFSIVLIPPVAVSLQKIDFIFPQLRHYPQNRQDIGEIYKILDFLNKTDVNETNKVYVLASGHILNDDILRNACFTAETQLSYCHQFVTPAHVDKRDGIPLSLFQAKYIVTTDPAEFHMKKEDQQVIDKMRYMIINQKGFGNNYKKLQVEFKLDKNVKVYIYQRLRSTFEANDLIDISDFFVELYPHHREKFLFPQETLKQLTE